MDFSIEDNFPSADGARREVMILACANKAFFALELSGSGADHLLWTTKLMAPEAYTLRAALDGWMLGESRKQIHQRAALAYAHYQKCSLTAAQHLFSSTW